MKDPTKTTQELLEEISILKQRNIEFERSEAARRSAEEALRINDMQLHTILESTCDAILAVDGVGNVIKTNQKFTDLWNLPSELLKGGNDEALLTYILDQLADPDAFIEKVNALYESTTENFDTILFKDGRIVERYSCPLLMEGAINGRVWSFRDVTEHKKADQALRDSQDQYRTLVENASDIVFRADSTGHFTFVNQAALCITEYEEKEIIGKHYLALIRTDMRDETMKFFGYQYVKGIQNTYFEYPILTKTGQEIWLGQNTQLISKDDHIVGFQAVARDITDRKRAEEALRNSESKYQFLAESMADVVFTLDLNLTTTYVSPSIERMLGYTPEERMAQKVDQQLTPDSQRLVFETLAAELNREKEKGAEPDRSQVLELEYYHKDGSIRDLVTYIRAIRDNEGNLTGIYGSHHDITERKRAEAEKRREREITERLAQEMVVIAEIGRVVGSTLDLNQVFERVATETRKLIPFDRFLVNLKKTPDGQFVVAYISGIDNPRRRTGDLYPRQGSATGVVMETRSGILIQPSEAEEIKDLYPNLYETFKTGLRSTMSVPLISMDEVIGTMNFRSQKPKAYTEQDLRLAERIGMQVAGAIANAQIYKELKEAEKSLRESEEKYRLIAENTADLISILDMNLRFTYVSPATIRLRGFTVEEAMSQTIEQVVTPESLRLGLDLFEKEMQLEASGTADPNRTRILELEEYKKDGSLIWVEVNLSFLRNTDGQPTAILIVSRDITERKRIEEALRKSEENYRQLFNNSPSAIYQIDFRTGKFLKANDVVCEYLGCSQEEITSLSPYELMTNESKQLLFKRLTKIGLGEKVPENPEYEIVDKNGKHRWIQLNSKNIFNSEGLIVGADVVAHDITDQKKAEEESRRLASVVRHSREVVSLAKPDGTMVFLNDAGKRILGICEEDIARTNIMDVIPEHLRDKVQQEVLPLIAGEKGYWEGELQYLNVKTGGLTDVHVKAYKIIDPETSALQFLSCVSQDITDRKRAEEDNRRLEERLQRSEKMEALGQLAGGVAHDLNNVLGILSGYSELLLMEIPEGRRARSHVEKILQSTEKGAAIIQDLLTLARRGVMASDVVNLNSIVSSFLKTPVFEKMKDHHPHVTFRTECNENLLKIKGSSIHLEKTLMNLVSNAAESISGQGEVTIRTQGRYLDKTIRGYDEVTEGDYAVLTVSDTGMGIPAENIEKIFEPFYTKKVMGRSGTGLGLTIVWGTVKDHNGYIDIQSEVDEGTTFTLYFPVTREEMIVPRLKEPIERYIGNGESILVVDDIAEQRDIASALLTQLGYKVHVIANGEEAVEYLRGNKADILILDMIMAPGIDGLETYKRVLEVNPKQKAILVSGFSETDRVKEAQRLGAGAYVKKPYVMGKIGVAIRDELNR